MKKEMIKEFDMELQTRLNLYPIWLEENRFTGFTKDMAEKRINLWQRAGIFLRVGGPISGIEFVITEVEREIKSRNRAYSKKVQSSTMHPEMMKKRIERIRAGLKLLKKEAGHDVEGPDILEQGSLF